MSLIRIASSTIQTEKMTILYYMILAGTLILLFNLMLDEVTIIYPLILSLVLLIIYLTFKAFSLYQFLSDLEASRTAGEFPHSSDNVKDRFVYTALTQIHTSYQDRLTALNEKLAGRNHLFTSFIHNMKSSTTIIELAAHKHSEESLADILQANEKLKSYLEQALNVLRLDEFVNDYVPECIDLHELVSSVINERYKEFIYAEVYPKLQDRTARVYTDKKWCSYMLEQIISNAIKYSPKKGKVYFQIECSGKQASLHIRDEGVGIPLEDLPRVFELFYTGQNGRASNNNATGIGLAMVKHIAKQLGHKVALSSRVGEGTRVSITFLTKM